MWLPATLPLPDCLVVCLIVKQANLLDYKEDVEDITNSALKELQIDEKLAAISDDWCAPLPSPQPSLTTFPNTCRADWPCSTSHMRHA
jgi:hypothetical protein